MATINIANLSFTHKGDYAGGTAYVKNDIVYYATNGNSYIAKGSTTGNVPTSTAHWDLFVAGSSGIWNAGLSLGSAGQQLRVNSGGNALEFATIAGGAFGQVVFNTNDTQYSNSSTSSYVAATNCKVDITPSATSKQILVMFNVQCHATGTDSSFSHQLIRSVGGSETVIRTTSSVYSYEHYAGTSGSNRYWQDTQFFVDSPNTTSQVTYTFNFKNAHNSNTLYINDYDESSFMALEIN